MSDPAPMALPSSDERYEDSPKGWQRRWLMEFKAARKENKDWQDKGVKIVERFLDKRDGKNMQDGIDTRWNFFTANVQTVECMMYGKTPKVDCAPKFADAPDSIARVASDILERTLNSDIERDEDAYKDALALCLKDRLLPGIGFMRFRYECEFEQGEETPAMVDEEGQELAPQVPAAEKKSYEECETDYIYWKDALWSPCRTFRDMRWMAFRASLSREEFAKKFGEEVEKKVGFDTPKELAMGQSVDAAKADPWTRVDVWEIEDKEHECRWFLVEGYGEVLRPIDLDDAQFNENGSLKDPLGLEGFWSFPRPMVANLTTSGFQPRADFTICEDLYDEIDRVSTRITELERAIGAKGVYDSNSGESVGRLLQEGSNNTLLPVQNWAAFAERGGIAGSIQLLPLDGIILALDKLRDYRNELIAASNQLTGMSDIVRGEASTVGTTATEQSIKARFASVRMQALQDEFARFATDAQKIRAEIIAKHFEPETIIERSNIMHSFDASDQEGLQQIQQAVQLIKSDVSCYRIQVKPEAISATDFAALKQERTEALAGLGMFIQNSTPMAQAIPQAMPYLMQMAQALMATMRGGEEIAGIFDKMVAHAQQVMAQQQAQPQQPPPPDPKLLANQQKASADMAKIQAQTQSELVRMNAETQALQQRKLTDSAIDIKEAAAKKAIQNGGVAPMPTPQGGPI